ncbi:interleukin 12 receptor, beta 2a, like [Trichomycterus rosablanca]|uniref:interleukin 12 receptor, beta 2a, like n=1 Tax=Trichomycterus rosablanca TaxID=2290929 RepID=UPI002F34EFFA
MAPWLTYYVVLPLLILYPACLCCPEGSFEVNIKCWWHKVTASTHNVSVECRADLPSSVLNCGLCHLRVVVPEVAARVSLTQCSRTDATFNWRMDEQQMQNATCMLPCEGHAPQNCTVRQGYPPPICSISNAEGNIHCHWTGSPNPINPTNFSLHWQQDDMEGKSRYINVGERHHGIIPREEYSTYSYIKVWVTDSTALSYMKSDPFVTCNTENIIQPSTPNITLHSSNPLEILWEMEAQWQCEVQYRKQCEQNWTEVKGFYEGSFLLEDTLPFTTYKFRVRCWVDYPEENIIMSNWSSVYSVNTPAEAPVGKLDVWSDCDLNSNDSSCTVFWKEMPKQQARGNISSYVVTVTLTNGSELNMDKAVREGSEMTCFQCGMNTVGAKQASMVSHTHRSIRRCAQDQDQRCFYYCHLSIPITDVKGIHVMANTSQGRSSPALVALPRTGLLQPTGVLNVTGAGQELNVSWSVPPQFAENVREYVVQHKLVGLPHTSCLNWVRVDKNRKSVTLRSQLANYTAYNVSLFAVVNNCSCLLQSAIAYTVEGVPPKVRDIQFRRISSSSIILTWTPVPLSKSRGRILNYIVGLNNHTKEHKVDFDKSSYQLSELNCSQECEVWISAVTSAGVGERTSATFTTNAFDGISVPIIVVPVVLTLVILGLFIVFVFCFRPKLFGWINRIPDPINSTSFKQMSNQFWHSWPESSNSISAQYSLPISQIEVIPLPKPEENDEQIVRLPELKELQSEPEEDRELTGDMEEGQQESRGMERSDSMLAHNRKEYSQVIDSSDEESRNDEDDDDDDEEWDEKPSSSDYERHFLPCIVDT